MVTEAGKRDADRLLDYDAVGPDWVSGSDPSADAALLISDRPYSASTVVVDLAGPEVAARLAGEWRGFGMAPDGSVWLASTLGLTRVADAAPAEDTDGDPDAD